MLGVLIAAVVVSDLLGLFDIIQKSKTFRKLKIWKEISDATKSAKNISHAN